MLKRKNRIKSYKKIKFTNLNTEYTLVFVRIANTNKYSLQALNVAQISHPGTQKQLLTMRKVKNLIMQNFYKRINYRNF